MGRALILSTVLHFPNNYYSISEYTVRSNSFQTGQTRQHKNNAVDEGTLKSLSESAAIHFMLLTGITQKEHSVKWGYVLCHLQFAYYQTTSKDKRVCMNFCFKLLTLKKKVWELFTFKHTFKKKKTLKFHFLYLGNKKICCLLKTCGH
jgi:hypothetical protein